MMNIAIGLPAGIPHVSGQFILEWAKLAEAGPFTSLSVIDRLVYPNYDPLVTLAAVSSVTERLRLMTSVLIAPLHNGGVLAKQAASLDAISHGRLTLGLGVGGREDDFLAAPASFVDRGKRFEQQLELMTRIWSGQSGGELRGAIGPAPIQQGGPEILLGAAAPKAVHRLGRWGHGFIAGAWGSEQTNQFFRRVEDIWRQAGRAGKPRLVGSTYYGLGPGAAERARAFLLDYYAFTGEKRATLRASSVPTSPEALRTLIEAFREIGTDELILWPCIADLDQVNRLADLLSEM